MTVDPGGPGTPMSERMQSLLSRAVEDQLSEQRQLAGVLADLRAQLARIGDDVAGLRQEGGDQAPTQAAVATVSADVREAVRLLGERLDGVARLLEAVDQGLRELRSAFAAVGARMAELPGRIDLEAASTRAVEPLSGFGERLDGLEHKVQAVHDRLAEMSEAAGRGSEREAVAGLREDLARVAGATADSADRAHERLAALETQAAAVLAALESLAAQPGDDDVDARVAVAVRDAVAATEGRLAAHIDEAVLALAEALLRRRARPPVPPPAPTGVPAAVAAPWQTPVATPVDASGLGASGPGAGEGEPDDGRRRPWWRPGD